MTIFELTNEYKYLLDIAEDPDVDPEILADTMDALEGEIEDKADGYGRVIRQMEADAAALKVEEQRLTTRRKTVEANIERMKKAFQNAMTAVGKPKIDTELFKFRIQKNPASVIIDEQYIENIPVEYLIEQEPKLDKAKIKEDLKAGKNLDGIAHLEQTETLRIK